MRRKKRPGAPRPASTEVTSPTPIIPPEDFAFPDLTISTPEPPPAAIADARKSGSVVVGHNKAGQYIADRWIAECRRAGRPAIILWVRGFTAGVEVEGLEPNPTHLIAEAIRAIYGRKKWSVVGGVRHAMSSWLPREVDEAVAEQLAANHFNVGSTRRRSKHALAVLENVRTNRHEGVPDVG